MQRRKFITSLGATATGLALAGCAGQDEPAGEGNETSPDGAEDVDGGTPHGTDKNVAVEEDDFFDIEQGEVNTPDRLKVLSSQLIRTEEGAGVIGEIKNTGDVAFSYLEVQATLYDSTDDVLGEFFDNTEESDISRLPPGAVWDFEIFFERADLGDVASYTLSAQGEVVGEAEDGAADEGDETAGNETNETSGNETGGGNETGSGNETS